jgi:dTDP-glucose 4,6-dehydratase
VKDHSRVQDAVLERGRSGEAYNIGGNNEWENIRLVKVLISVLHKQTRDPRISDELIRKTVKWYLMNKE